MVPWNFILCRRDAMDGHTERRLFGLYKCSLAGDGRIMHSHTTTSELPRTPRMRAGHSAPAAVHSISAERRHLT